MVRRSRQCGSPASCERREAADQRADRHRRLELGQRRAEAVVDAGGEREVAVGVRPVEVQRRRDRRTSPGRGWRRRAPSSPSMPGRHGRRRRSAPPRSGCARSAAPGRRSAAARRPPRRRATDRRASARSSSGWRSRASVPLPIRLTVVSWPGDVEQHDERHQLGGGEAVAGLLDQRAARQQVVAEVLAAVVDDLARGTGRAGRWPRRRRRASSSSAVGSSAAVSVCDHVADLGLALGRHAEQVGDHLERHREGELVDELHRAPLGGPVEHVVDELLRRAAAAARWPTA